jgi:poly(3-hydroxybutyrate) depolymerase
MYLKIMFPKKNNPLIVQLHGGGMDGMRWTKMTAWHLLAERRD